MKKVVFFGGKDVGSRCLKTLIEKTDVRLIITNTSDLDNGVEYEKISFIALDCKIPHIVTNNPHTDKILSLIKDISPDFIFVVYYDAILKFELFNIPKEGAINLHLADAEKYRWCFPTTHAIINGDMEYGATLHYIDKGIDTGDIIGKTRFSLKRSYTGKDLYKKATEEGVKLFERKLPLILKGEVSSTPQIKKSEHAYNREFPSHEITFEGSGRQVYNKIRALVFEPFPMPHFYIGKNKYEIVKKTL